MKRKRYRCEECGEQIDERRVLNALTRGVEPRFCSNACRDRSRVRRHREKKRRA